MAATVRFEVLLNGKRRCVAGVDGFGVISAVVDWVIRDPRAKPVDYSDEEWSAQRLKLHVGGLVPATRQLVNWLDVNLATGDEVTIRVLGPGEFDEPSKVSDDGDDGGDE